MTLEEIQAKCHENAVAAAVQLLKLEGADTPEHPLRNINADGEYMYFEAWLETEDGSGYSGFIEPIREQKVLGLHRGKGALLYLEALIDCPDVVWDVIRQYVKQKAGLTGEAKELRRDLLCSGLIKYEKSTDGTFPNKLWNVTELGKELLDNYECYDENKNRQFQSFAVKTYLFER